MLTRLKPYVHLLRAALAYWWYGRPARKLIVVGVTGTKGKSTTCRLIASVLEAGGHKVGLLSTVEFQIGDKRWLNDKKMTMLGRGHIQSMLRKMVKAGCTYAVVETSSEGILQFRHFGLLYDIAVFTNLGTEHSERHGGFENLKHDKGKMFTALSEYRKKINGKIVDKVTVVNADDAHADYYLEFPADQQWVFSLNNTTKNVSHRVDGAITEQTEQGTDFAANGKPYHLNIVGDFNVANALAAVAVGLSQEIAPISLAHGLEAVRLVEGRMEYIDAGQPFKAIVDYAHEPLSLTALFTNLRSLTKGKVISIIGSDGGGRDVGKRAKMGEIAGSLTDIVVVTDVNCFDEDPAVIAEMLAVGARKAGKKDGTNLFIETDRRLGIRKAVSLCKAGDTVVVTAKGTEPCIMVANGKRIPWDDRTVMREELQALQEAYGIASHNSARP